MEAIALIIGELIYAICVPIVIAVFDALVSLAAAIVSLFGLLLPKRKRDKPATASPDPGAPPPQSGHDTASPDPAGPARDRPAARIANVIAVVSLGIAVLAGGALWTINRFYFAEAVQFTFDTLERRTGIGTACERATGSVFTGEVRLETCTTERRVHDASTFALHAELIDMDLDMRSIFGRARVERARVTGLTGWVERDAPAGPDADTDAAATVKPRRAFVVDDLAIQNVDVALSGRNADGNPYRLDVQVEQLSSQPLRSRLALFDLLFRSNASGTLAGAPFTIATGTRPEGRTTTWRAERVPIAELGAVAGGALAWFAEGTVDVRVDDAWAIRDAGTRRKVLAIDDITVSTNSLLQVELDWQLDFAGIRVAAPAGTGRMTALVSQPLTRYVNGLGGEFPLRFQLVVTEEQFAFRQSLAAAGFWRAVGDAIRRWLEAAGVAVPTLSAEEKAKLKERGKSLLDRLRKREDGE